jgi:galactose mutarotase-like enzyme
MEFSVTEQKKDSVTLTLASSDETRKFFPYEFVFHMNYRFEEDRLVTEFRVENPGDEVLPFAVGGHPAFNCPVTEGERFEDYVVEFEKPETARCPVLDMKTGLIDFHHRVTVMESETALPMRHELFYKDALMFDTPRSRVVRLVNHKTGRGVEMDFADFCYLGVWSAVNDAPFVALEPWVGCATGEDEDNEFLHKRAITLLKPGKTASFAFGVKAL